MLGKFAITYEVTLNSMHLPETGIHYLDALIETYAENFASEAQAVIEEHLLDTESIELIRVVKV